MAASCTSEEGGMMRLALLFLLLYAAAPAHAADVKEVVSPGGIKAWLVEEHSLPLVAIRLSFEGSGFAYDPSGREGLANFTATMLTEGAGDLGDRAFNEALEARAIEMNTAVNQDSLEVAMQSLSEHKDLAFSYLGMAVAKPRFDVDAVERTRRQMLSILKQSEQNPGYLMERSWAKEAFGDHPYGRPQLGTSSSLARLDRYDMQRYAERYLTRGNLLVAVVGDITPEELRPLLDKHFSSLPEKYKPETKIPDVQIAAGKKPVAVDFNIPQTLVTFGLQGLKRSDPDYIAAYVMTQILAGDSSLTSRLGKEIREKRGLSYTVYARLTPFDHGGMFTGGFATRTEETHTALAVLKDTLDTFVKEGPSAEELSQAKQYLVGSFVINLDSNADLAGFLINMQHNRLGIDYLKRRDELIGAVTRNDVTAQARRLLDTRKLIIIKTGKPTTH
jgi:zinc protease